MNLPPMIACKCGDMMPRMTVENAYGQSVNCDECSRKMKISELTYHCNSHCFCLNCAGELLTNQNTLGLVHPIKCICGSIMKLSQPKSVYNSSANCNNITCRARINLLEYCYHCPRNKTSVHPKGYDFCMKCSRLKSSRPSNMYHPKQQQQQQQQQQPIYNQNNYNQKNNVQTEEH
eukprot:489669_1